MLLRQCVRLVVRRRAWYSGSRPAHGSVDEKKSFSWSLASAHEMPALSALESGCLTANQPFASGSLIFLMKLIQEFSSPCGIRSGFVRTPRESYE
jgi:hypothetical protein